MPANYPGHRSPIGETLIPGREASEPGAARLDPIGASPNLQRNRERARGSPNSLAARKAKLNKPRAPGAGADVSSVGAQQHLSGRTQFSVKAPGAEDTPSWGTQAKLALGSFFGGGSDTPGVTVRPTDEPQGAQVRAHTEAV